MTIAPSGSEKLARELERLTESDWYRGKEKLLFLPKDLRARLIEALRPTPPADEAAPVFDLSRTFNETEVVSSFVWTPADEDAVEMVQQAIADAQFGGRFNGLEWPEAWDHFGVLAQAALEALSPILSQARKDAFEEAAVACEAKIRLGHEGYDLTGFRAENNCYRNCARILRKLKGGEE